MFFAGGLFFVSGFAGLTYQVLWQRQLGLLFGNTTQATSTALAVFFLGLAAGSWWIGRRSAHIEKPLGTFGRLEVGVALSALLLPLLLPLYRAVFAPLYGALGDSPAAFLAVKFGLAALVLAPPAFLMGGTLPVLSELAVRRGRGFARSGSLLYGVNTAGALLGAFAAGFVLPRLLGFRAAYGVAIAASLCVGVLALRRARRGEAGDGAPRADPQARAAVRPALLALAAFSGFAALALEVLWTRLFALVFTNSVYTFAAILVIFLAAIVVGAWAANLIGRRCAEPRLVLRRALLVAGALVGLSVLLFRLGVGLPDTVGAGADFAGYTLATFLILGTFVLPPAIAVGFVFPFLLRVEEERGVHAQAGRRLGALLAANTVGALLGALAAGFLLPGLIGSVRAVAVVAALYALAATLTGGWRRSPPLGRLLSFGLLVIFAFALGPTSGRGKRGERVVGVYEGSAGTVTVVNRGGHLKLKFNESYTLGGTVEPRWEAYQSHIPLCLHGAPKRVFYVGLGTGITAGAALHHDVDSVRVAEIVPQAVKASREHFTPWVNGLFEDPRVDIVVEDARTVLLGLEDTYDVVIGDLFLPWKRGTALLYTVEQFEAVRARLAPKGLFAQWLPLYQMGEAEFLGIARAFHDVFPNARVWRGNFFARRPIVALVGMQGDAPLDAERMAAAWRRLEDRGAIAFGPAVASLPFLFQVGPLAAVRAELEAARINTDDRPWLQFEAPVSQRARVAGSASAFVSSDLAAFERRILAGSPVGADPYLSRLTPVQRRYVEGGMHMYEYGVRYETGYSAAGRGSLAGFIRNVPSAVRPPWGDWLR